MKTYFLQQQTNIINTYSGNDNIPSKKMKKQCARFSSLEYIALIITDNIGSLTVDIYMHF